MHPKLLSYTVKYKKKNLKIINKNMCYNLLGPFLNALFSLVFSFNKKIQTNEIQSVCQGPQFVETNFMKRKGSVAFSKKTSANKEHAFFVTPTILKQKVES